MDIPFPESLADTLGLKGDSGKTTSVDSTTRLRANELMSAINNPDAVDFIRGDGSKMTPQELNEYIKSNTEIFGKLGLDAKGNLDPEIIAIIQGKAFSDINALKAEPQRTGYFRDIGIGSPTFPRSAVSIEGAELEDKPIKTAADLRTYVHSLEVAYKNGELPDDAVIREYKAIQKIIPRIFSTTTQIRTKALADRTFQSDDDLMEVIKQSEKNTLKTELKGEYTIFGSSSVEPQLTGLSPRIIQKTISDWTLGTIEPIPPLPHGADIDLMANDEEKTAHQLIADGTKLTVNANEAVIEFIQAATPEVLEKLKADSLKATTNADGTPKLGEDGTQVKPIVTDEFIANAKAGNNVLTQEGGKLILPDGSHANDLHRLGENDNQIATSAYVLGKLLDPKNNVIRDGIEFRAAAETIDTKMATGGTPRMIRDTFGMSQEDIKTMLQESASKSIAPTDIAKAIDYILTIPRDAQGNINYNAPDFVRLKDPGKAILFLKVLNAQELFGQITPYINTLYDAYQTQGLIRPSDQSLITALDKKIALGTPLGNIADYAAGAVDFIDNLKSFVTGQKPVEPLQATLFSAPSPFKPTQTFGFQAPGISNPQLLAFGTTVPEAVAIPSARTQEPGVIPNYGGIRNVASPTSSTLSGVYPNSVASLESQRPSRVTAYPSTSSQTESYPGYVKPYSYPTAYPPYPSTYSYPKYPQTYPYPSDYSYPQKYQYSSTYPYTSNYSYPQNYPYTYPYNTYSYPSVYPYPYTYPYPPYKYPQQPYKYPNYPPYLPSGFASSPQSTSTSESKSGVQNIYSPSLLPFLFPNAEKIAEETYSPLTATSGLRPIKAPAGAAPLTLNSAALPAPQTITTSTVPGVESPNLAQASVPTPVTTNLSGTETVAFGRSAPSQQTTGMVIDPATLTQVATPGTVAGSNLVLPLGTSAPTSPFQQAEINQIASAISAAQPSTTPATSLAQGKALAQVSKPSAGSVLSVVQPNNAPLSQAATAVFSNSGGGQSLVPSGAVLLSGLGANKLIALLNQIDPTSYNSLTGQHSNMALLNALNNLSLSDAEQVMNMLPVMERANIYLLMGINGVDTMGAALALASGAPLGGGAPLASATGEERKRIEVTGEPGRIFQPRVIKRPINVVS